MAAPYNHSWITRRLANRFPLWSDGRLKKYSWLQQFLNPMGLALENIYKQLAIGAKNYYAATSNLDEIDVVYKINLPRNFNFSINDRDLANPIHIPPIVKGIIGTTEISIENAANNDVESFWYDAYPTRTQLEGDTTSIATDILPATQLKDLASATINTLPLEGRVSITMTGATEFINLRRALQRGFVKIAGTTRKGIEETEIIYFITNTTLSSLKEWRRIDSVTVHGIFPLTATINITMFAFDVPEVIDPLNLFVDEVNEKVLFPGVECQDYSGSVLYHKVLAANNLGLIQQGFTEFDIRERAELLDMNDQAIVCNDFAVQPFQDKVFVLADDKLYIFDNKMPYPSLKNLIGKTEDALMLVETERDNYIRDQIVKINTYRRFPVKRVLKNRWALIKPDGTKVRLGLDGTEWPLAQRGWILNSHSHTFNFIRQRIQYIATEIGTYTVELEVAYHDGTTEIDRTVFNVNALNARAALDLPTQVQNADGIAFDSDQNLWISKGDTAYKMQLLTDNMLVDFEKRIIYLHENYDKVIVETGG